MLPRHHQAVLVDLEAGRVLVRDVEDDWPSVADLRAAVGDPSARPVSVPVRHDDGRVVNVLATGTASAGDGRDWTPPTDELVGVLRELRGGPPDDGRPDWWRLDWAAEVDAWVDGLLTARGAVRLAPGEVVKMWSLSAVARHRVREADGHERDLWFKATCDGFRAEPGLTAWLAAALPGHLPSVLAHDVARAWMVLEPVVGADDVPDVDLLTEVAGHHARAQLAMPDRTEELLALGAPDRGVAVALVSASEAGVAEPWVVDALTELDEVGLPLTLVHGDLHGWNLGRAAADGRPVVFDWTDACLARPYLDGRHLATSVTRSVGVEAGEAVRSAYLEEWRRCYPDVDHDRAWELANVADRALTLGSYLGIYAAQRSADRWELGGFDDDVRAEVLALRPPVGPG